MTNYSQGNFNESVIGRRVAPGKTGRRHGCRFAMKRKLVMLSFVLLLGLGASFPASAEVVFQASGNLQNIRLEGTAEAVGTVSLVAIADGSIGAGSLINFNFKTNLITNGTATCSAAACVAPTNFTLSAIGSVLRVTFVTNVAFTAGNSLEIAGARCAPSGLVGQVEGNS